MCIKWMGSAVVVAACSSIGFLLARGVSREAVLLCRLLCALDTISGELAYRRPVLPDLCKSCGAQIKGDIGDVLHRLGTQLELHSAPDVGTCMSDVLLSSDLPWIVKAYLSELGDLLGCFDVEGQLQSLSRLQERIQMTLHESEVERTQQQRLYRTLGICAGVALMIILY